MPSRKLPRLTATDVLVLIFFRLLWSAMSGPLPLFPDARRTPALNLAHPDEVEDAIRRAIMAGTAGYLPRTGALMLAGLCARTIAERLAAAGLVVMREEDQA